MSKLKKSLSLLNPVYWPAWVGLVVLRLIVMLPLRWQYKIGVKIGQLLFAWPSRLKQITQTNIKLCFPDMSLPDQQQLAKKNFISIGLGLIETGMAWWLSAEKLRGLYHLQGLTHLQNAHRKNKGVLLIAPHSTCIEIVGRLMGLHHQFGVMYRPHKKLFIEFMHENFRKKHYATYIPRQNIRQLLRALQQNIAIWYAYDIDGGKKRSLFAPFFGVPTASLTAVSRILKLSGAAVVPISYYRRDNEFFYDVVFSPMLEDFPTPNQTDDLTLLNKLIESAIRKKPEQYVWQYKRFKTRPQGEKKLY